MKTGKRGACQKPITPVSGSLQGEDIILVPFQSINYTNLRWLVFCNHNMPAAGVHLCYFSFGGHVGSKLGKVVYMRPQESVSSCVFCMMLIPSICCV